MDGYQKATTPHVSWEVVMSCFEYDIISFHEKLMTTSRHRAASSDTQILKCRHLIFKSLKISRSVFKKNKNKNKILFPEDVNADCIPQE